MTDRSHNKHTKRMLVRYGKLGFLGWFSHSEQSLPKTKTKVIIKTERGLELGELVGANSSYVHGNFKGNFNTLQEYFELDHQDYPLAEGGEFVRIATAQDINEAQHVRDSAGEELKICREYVDKLGLKMKIVDFEHIFGGERIVFYFLADGRVDFRELVKQLAQKFQTRIEMRQIGARDEARLISDIETCGQECCCRRYLKILKPVNMRMAKTQKATLDPSKISGHCGRLRCCLRYEDKTYQQLKKELPNRQSWVKTPAGYGRVIDYQILTQILQIQYEDGKMEALPADEVEVLEKMPEEVRIAREAAREKQQQSEQSPRRSDTKAEGKNEREQNCSEKTGGEGEQEEKNRGDSEKQNGNKSQNRKGRKGGKGKSRKAKNWRKNGEKNAQSEGEDETPSETAENE
ncbi:hypothetical protein L21SP3_00272 [Sedimentisphaera cyanobacteriorum]|uniref:PSP1 C-terminal domain-containing protein n=1 Tax=Sedimentisphaera cyanobacteriorum TaxID=1940790 RepID=A0A1Q2HMH6_9BACT|nr:regulatory iron-sulfur-containing complex subunit RicT [Sedimentisphaera cyanobacteriorum]AQQ08491.1 hypothetical protein L21SP3_00272 [Sedimentisphaera cyanobacteriorum]